MNKNTTDNQIITPEVRKTVPYSKEYARRRTGNFLKGFAALGIATVALVGIVKMDEAENRRVVRAGMEMLEPDYNGPVVLNRNLILNKGVNERDAPFMADERVVGQIEDEGGVEVSNPLRVFNNGAKWLAYTRINDDGESVVRWVNAEVLNQEDSDGNPYATLEPTGEQGSFDLQPINVDDPIAFQAVIGDRTIQVGMVDDGAQNG